MSKDKDAAIKQQLRKALSGARSASIGTYAEPKKKLPSHEKAIDDLLINYEKNERITLKTLSKIRALTKVARLGQGGKGMSDDEIIEKMVPSEIKNLQKAILDVQDLAIAIVRSWARKADEEEGFLPAPEMSERDKLCRLLGEAVMNNDKAAQKDIQEKLAKLV